MAADAKPGRPVRTPTVLQLEATECGAASLAMVLAAHGRWVPLDELRVACGVSRDGSKAGNIVRAARRYGMEAKGFRLDPAELKSLPMPAILFVNLNHFLVLEGFRKGRVHLNDPAAGRRVLTEEEFDRIYSGIALTFVPTAAFERGGARPGLIDRLLARLEGARVSVLLVILAGLGLVVPGFVVPGFSRIFVDQYLIERQEDWVIPLLLTMAAAAMVQGGLLWLRQAVLQRLKTRIAIREASGFVQRMLRLPIGFFAQRYAGAIGGRTDLAPALAQHAAGALTVLVIEALSLLFFAAVMLAYSPLLTAVTVACAAGNIALFLLMRRRQEEWQRKATQDQVKLTGKTMQGLQMIESLKANGTDGPFFEGWSGLHALVETQHQRIARGEAVFALVPEAVSHLATVAVLVAGGMEVMAGSLTIGMLVAFQSLQGAFNAPVQSLMQAGVALQGARGTLDQFDDVAAHAIAGEFARDEERAGGDRGAPVGATGLVRRLSGRTAVRGLAFGYNPLEAPLVQDFELGFEPGTRVALVGASGSGKSTIGRMVAGLFDPWAGEILFDERPPAGIARDVLRNSLAVVDQDIVLFEGTVRDNITLWDDTMPEARVVRAARDAMIHDTILARTGGYDSHVEEGGRNFSGGERQRIEIARALVTDPSLLILDEATSALDPLVEKAIMDNLRRRGCTCLIIAHRLSTIRDCDEIVVMDRGRIVQRGTHEAMAAADGPYRRLVEA
ncbi:NHLP family bacteriocin export ABC transporter peptidase/permease/ATPase subunit [Azospirillum thermophilum]|uniref:NHLP family bacteriocin export ABC transporter peptidase/permease/ATPase subunit n=1 Tax=Azospirillum thermophilum TaxID=2202148 RepID=A0A2S2CW78_9PROT|nr:NHLP family bacteriocin export ABC transporter peptidase/permease/ATPase subunit [Azospirillum thermophilum]AWK88783.1 NHLP family bacteriocin export ABC transporter peptidase/permease/ATPase subunit [Azospirillum thermophilum]